jgi:uncharacterized protein
MLISLTSNISKLWLLITAILFILVFSYIQITKPASKMSLSIATGSIGSDSYAYALSYQALLADEGVSLDIIPTNGSLDTLGYLHSKKADVGFVHSGILLNKREYQIESLGSIYYEPLWIFYRNDGFKINYLIEATGKNLGISISNDGTYDLAKKLSQENGLIENVHPVYLQDEEALKQLKKKKIDIFITLATKDNQSIIQLLNDPKIELMNIKRINAYTQKFDYLKPLKLYEGSIDLYKNIPSNDIHLLSTTQNLVAQPDVPGELVRILLKKINKIHKGQEFFQKDGEFINMDSVDTVMNDDAQLYIINGESWLERIFPYWIASNIDRLKLFIIPILWLIFPLFKSIIPLYILTTRAKIFRWYEKLDFLNKELKNKNIDKQKLNQELIKLKYEVENKTNVPLSYKGEYYNLIVHIELLENKIKQL